MSPSITRAIRKRALILKLLSGIRGEWISESDARRMAAAEIAERQRKSRNATAPRAAIDEPITIHNARAIFIRRVEQVAQRLRDFDKWRARTASAPADHQAALSVTLATPHPVAITKPAQPEPALGPQVVGVWTSGVSTAQLIDDAEFEPRYRESEATRNWRESIQRNNEISRRNGRWIG